MIMVLPLFSVCVTFSRTYFDCEFFILLIDFVRISQFVVFFQLSFFGKDWSFNLTISNFQSDLFFSKFRRRQMIMRLFSNRIQQTEYQRFNIQGILNSLSPNINEQILRSCLHTFLINVFGKNCYKYQENSLWVITSLILMTSGVPKHWY